VPAPTKVLILPPPPLGAVKTHALDCRWASGYKTGWTANGVAQRGYEEADAATVPSEAGRCSHCGGGR
jgi:hypothetical protein